jgi:hypothetical protein
MSKTHKYGNVQESLLKIQKLKDFDFCLQVEPDLKDYLSCRIFGGLLKQNTIYYTTSRY